MIDNELFLKELVTAKQKCYANNKVEKIGVNTFKSIYETDGSRYIYTDEYSGTVTFSGIEKMIDKETGECVWNMAYTGHVYDVEKFDYKFFKDALKTGHANPTEFARGTYLRNDKLLYSSILKDGDVTYFRGIEKIVCRETNKLVFETRFTGGFNV